MINNISIKSGTLDTHNRDINDTSILKEYPTHYELVFFQTDTLQEYEKNLNLITGCSSKFYIFRKKLTSYILSTITVTILLFALLSSSIYEDISKKIIFESPFTWELSDYISIIFVLIFFFGLVLMPSILEGEGSQLKEFLNSWFNKETRKLKKINTLIKSLDKTKEIHCFNFDLLQPSHWSYVYGINFIVKHFSNTTFHVRNDQKKILKATLLKLKLDNITVIKHQKKIKDFTKTLPLLSVREKNLLNLLSLCSTFIIKQNNNKNISLELFEYCSRNFLNTKENLKENNYSFQNFINRSFDDFGFLIQNANKQTILSFDDILDELEDEKRRLSYFLRNHIENIIKYFDNPISLLILYYFVKDIIIDKNRLYIIIEELINTIYYKQQYELIKLYWFDMCGEMFESQNIDNFEQNTLSIYNQLSLSSLEKLLFLFERNGNFEQALLLAKHLYEINPNKFSISICSLYERMGLYDQALDSLPKFIPNHINQKPSDIEVRFYQRKSWIIVSQRKESLKDEGIKCLEELSNLLFSHSFDNEPIWLWNYYNIKANYCEWNQEYDNAIEFYKKCLSIPTLGAFEYGASFVNMAISYRFKFIQSLYTNIQSINSSNKYAQIGTNLKTMVGDRDELPVVLHNQALNLLYKQIIDFNKDDLTKTISITNKAIEMLDETNSIKRLGILLFENILANDLNETPSINNHERLKSIWNNLNHYEKSLIKDLYKIFLEKNLSKTIDWI